MISDLFFVIMWFSISGCFVTVLFAAMYKYKNKSDLKYNKYKYRSDLEFNKCELFQYEKKDLQWKRDYEKALKEL